MSRTAPQHGDERNRREESEWTAPRPHTGHGLTVSVSERWCATCQRWVEIRGVMGGLRWMAEHEHAEVAS